MNCPSCQAPLPPAARFCGVCGHQLQSPAPAAPRPAAAPQPVTSVAPSRPGSEPAIPGLRRADRGSEPNLLPSAQDPLRGPGPPRPGASAPAKPPGLGRRKPEGDPFLGLLLNGRFKIESKLGEGGFGAVYRGTQVQSGRKVALKLLHPEMTRDENLVARFRREGLVLCNLRDPHTITTYDFDQTPEGTLYIAMELLEGKSLHTVFHNEAPIEWRRVLKILAQMCSSLGEAHRQGIVHRDLKPENIYLENRGGDPEFVKILDFGIAKVMRGDNSVDPQAPQLTATGQTLGTLEYMSPEQLMGKQLDGRSDVYALGVLGYELLTGRLPFPDAKGPAALITAQLKQTPKPPSAVNPAANLPVGVDRIIGKTLEKDKNARFADVGALAAACQECLATGRWGDPPGTIPSPLPVASPIASPVPALAASGDGARAPDWNASADAMPTHPPDVHGRPTQASDRAQRGGVPPRPGPTPYPPPPHAGGPSPAAHASGPSLDAHGGPRMAPGHSAPPPILGAGPGGGHGQPLGAPPVLGPGMPPAALAHYPPQAHDPHRHAPSGFPMSAGSDPNLAPYGYPPAAPAASNRSFVWVLLALVAIGLGVGVTLAFVL